MRQKFVGNKQEIEAVVIKNNDTVAIFNGAPVVLDFGATTELGVMVKTTNSLAAAEQGNFYGVAYAQRGSSIAVNEYAEAQVFGYCSFARVVLTTRATSTDVWASYAAASIGEYLTMQTGTGSTAAAGDQALIPVATAAQTVAQFARMAQTFASATTQASSTGPQSVTVWTTTSKIFLRAM